MGVECSNLMVIINVLAILPQCTMMELTTETLIECASDKDFTFQLHNSKLNVSLPIAECDVVHKSCFMFTKTNSHNYNVTYTGHSGLLKIRVLDKSTIGSYQCFDTFDPKIIVSTNIAPSDYKLAIESCTEYTQGADGAGETDTTGHIVLGTLKNASIECSSNVGLTFTFFSNRTKTPVIIAVCDFTEKECLKFPTSLQNKYSLQYTGCGGVMKITSLDNDTIGEYTCFETFNPTNNISFIISFPFTDAEVNSMYNVTVSTESNDENNWMGNGTQSAEIIGIVIGVISAVSAVIPVIGCMVIFSKKKSKLCFASETTKSSAKQDLESSVALISKENDGKQEPSGEESLFLIQGLDYLNDYDVNQSRKEETLQMFDDRVAYKKEMTLSLISPLSLQDIILSGYRLAVSNGHTHVFFEHRHVLINDYNINVFLSIWAGIAPIVQSLRVTVDVNCDVSVTTSAVTCEDSAPQMKFDLSSCHTLKQLTFDGVWLALKDFSCSTKLNLPVLVSLNSNNSAPGKEPTQVLPSVERIKWEHITCTSTWLRNLLNALMTLDHMVECKLQECVITSRDVIEKTRRLCLTIHTTIVPGLIYTFEMHNITNPGPGLCEVLFGLKIRALSMSGDWSGLITQHVLSFSKSLSSLKELESLSIEVHEDSPDLWKVLRGLHIQSLRLSGNSGVLNVNNVLPLSQSLSSLSKLNMLIIDALHVSAGVWKALEGLKIKCLSLNGGLGGMIMNDDWMISSLSKSLTSLSMLDTLSMHLREYIDIPIPQSARYLNLYFDSLGSYTIRDLVKNLSSFTQSADISVGFGCAWFICEKTPPDEYITIQQELVAMKNVAVKRFQIYEETHNTQEGIDRTRYARAVVVDVTDSADDKNYYYIGSLSYSVALDHRHHDNYDYVDKEAYKRFVSRMQYATHVP